MTQATLSETFQISIPETIRERLALRAGQQFVIVTKGESIVLVPKRSAGEVRGLMRGANPDNYRDPQDRY